ncbi:MAG: phenylalanine--tRNA ligase subunit beta [candidate division Zixibacteria bacterium]|nr:phenylalanine--tRNA ligase subunit beta [candidate division Zixibacteria bacterium]
MQIPYSWITELTGICCPSKELAERLTLCGTAAAVSKFAAGGFENIVVGQIAELEMIKGSDHLKKAVVNLGDKTIEVACGAPNAREGQKVIVAQVGAILKGGLEIKKVTLRGVESSGLICSEAELGLTDDHSGIMVLDDDAPISVPAGNILGLDDDIFEFDLTPNRPDSLCAIGIARDVAALYHAKIKRPEYELHESEEKASAEVKVSIDDSGACPRYAARVIKDVKIGPSPWWIKRKLLLSGIRPISNVVDITNLVMLELGHPLHAFDFRLFGRKEVMVRRARAGEKFTTLDGIDHELTPEVLLITDGEKGVAAAGVMGGLNSEVTAETTDILLESAYFDSITIRKSRLKLGMVSESSTRFEKGADPNVVPEALNRAAYLIRKYAGGKVLSGIVDCYPKKITPINVNLRPARVNVILGTTLTAERMVEILQGLEFPVTQGENLQVTVPTFRPDITREIDLIEEIARIEGYDRIPSADRNIGPLLNVRHKDDLFRRLLRNAMTAQGFDEIYGSGFADPGHLAKLSPDIRPVKILNPIADDLAVMQTTLVYSLLKAVAHNTAFRNLDLRLFELGKSFESADSASPAQPPAEIEQIGIALSGKSDDRWFGRGRVHDFYELKGAIDSLLDSADIPPVGYIPANVMPCAEGYGYQLHGAGKEIGRAGLVREDIARIFDIKQPVFIAELDLKELANLWRLERSYEPLPRFPAAPRDLAIVVDESAPVGEIMEAIERAGKPLLEKVALFDLYRGKQIGEGKKSLAFSLTFRSPERSLENKEVVEIHEKIVYHIKEKFNAEIREG